MTLSAGRKVGRPLRELIERGAIPVPFSGCWIWLGSLDTGGYGQINFNKKGMRAHRASWAAFRGPVPQDTKVLHHCDIRPCVNPDHLFLGTQLDNVRDMMGKGREKLLARAKLTLEQANEIRTLSEPRKVIAARYGVSRNAVRYIQLGKTWRAP